MPYQFTDSIPYLLNRAGVRLGDRFAVRLADHGVTLPAYRVLAALRQHGPVSLGELSELVTVELSTLSRLVGQLAKRDLLSRIRPEENGRIVSIELTKEGALLADKLMPIAAMFEQTAVYSLQKEEIGHLKNLLRSINENIAKL